MQEDSIISRKYATALFGAARKSGEIDAVDADMGALLELMRQSPVLLKFLESPREGTERKREFLSKVLGGRTAPITFRFVNLLLDKKRTAHLAGIAEKFEELARKHKGIVKALVTTAVPLEADQAGRLTTELGKLTGKTVQIETHVDPAVLGGVIVAYDNQIIDRSVRRGLDDLRETLMKVRVL